MNNKQKYNISQDAGWSSGYNHNLSTGAYPLIGTGRERGCRRGLGFNPQTEDPNLFALLIFFCSLVLYSPKAAQVNVEIFSIILLSSEVS